MHTADKQSVVERYVHACNASICTPTQPQTLPGKVVSIVAGESSPFMMASEGSTISTCMASTPRRVTRLTVAR